MPRTPRCKCIECDKTFDVNQVRVVGDKLMRLFLAVRLSKRIDCNDYICQKCRSNFLHWKQKMEGDFDKYDSYDRIDTEFVNDNDNRLATIDNNSEHSMELNQLNISQPDSISIPIFRCAKSHRLCIVCGMVDPLSSKVLSKEQRTMIFLKRGIFVSPGARCCSEHIYQGHLTIESFNKICVSQADRLNIDSVGFQEFLSDVRTILFSQKNFDFDDPSCLDEEAYRNIVGLKKEQFDHLVQSISSMRNSQIRSVRVAVAIFLVKMRLGLSNRVLAVLFHLNNKRVVSHIIGQVRKALMKDFVPFHLGLQHIDHQVAIDQHQTAIATILHTTKPNQLCVVADATYLFIQKSIDNQFQRKSYSMHKHRNLVKPLILTTTDGYILCVLGTFLSDYSNNDASIIKNCFRNNEQDVLNWLHKDDVLIVDRGFRDAASTIKHFGYEVVMPSFLKRRKQFTTKEANHIRLITKVRWVIESVNGQIKQWKYFSQTIQNSSLRFINDYLHIVCSLINAFASRPVSDVHSGSEVAFRMLEVFNESNDVQMLLSKIVTERSEWIKYDAKMCPFPELDEQDLRDLCFGSYQVKQAISYINEHLTPSIFDDDELEFVIELCSKYDDLVRARFASRHSNSKTYIAIIQYNTKHTEHPINGWYCTCIAGWRDVGCCGHITALLWHLGVCRAEINQNIHPLSASKIFAAINDSAQFSDVGESDDEQNNSDDENNNIDYNS